MSTLNEILYEAQLDQIYIDQKIFNMLLEDTILGEGVGDLAHSIWEKIKEICKNIMDFFRKIGKWIKEKFLKIIGQVKKDVEKKEDIIKSAESIDAEALEDLKNATDEDGNIKLSKLTTLTEKDMPRILKDYKVVYDADTDVFIEKYINFSFLDISYVLEHCTKSNTVDMIKLIDFSLSEPRDSSKKNTATQKVSKNTHTPYSDLHEGMSAVKVYFPKTYSFLGNCTYSGDGDRLFTWAEYKKLLNEDAFEKEKIKLITMIEKRNNIKAIVNNIYNGEKYLSKDLKEHEADYTDTINVLRKNSERYSDDIEAVKNVLNAITILESEVTNITNIRLELCKGMIEVCNKAVNYVWQNLYVVQR